MKKIETTLNYKKSTPGTHRYEEPGNDPVIRNLYIVQKFVEGEAPEKIKVTIESA